MKKYILFVLAVLMLITMVAKLFTWVIQAALMLAVLVVVYLMIRDPRK